MACRSMLCSALTLFELTQRSHATLARCSAVAPDALLPAASPSPDRSIIYRAMKRGSTICMAAVSAWTSASGAPKLKQTAFYSTTTVQPERRAIPEISVSLSLIACGTVRSPLTIPPKRMQTRFAICPVTPISIWQGTMRGRLVSSCCASTPDAIRRSAHIARQMERSHQ